MATFKDASGAEWRLRITVADVARVRDLEGVDLMELFDPESGLAERLEDVVELITVLWALVRPQAAAHGIDPSPEGGREFAERFGGDAIADATRALLEAAADFCPSLGTRAMLRETMAAQTAMETTANEMMIETAGAIRAERSRMTSGPPSGSAPASSASSPGDLVSESFAKWREGGSGLTGTATQASSPPS